MSKPSSSSDTAPLPLTDTLRDLALLRASDIDLASILKSSAIPDASISAIKPTPVPVDDEKETLVERSYEFVHEARAALRIVSRDDVNAQGKRIDNLRNGLEETIDGMNGDNAP
jgi:hypothetical protein